ncbi:glycosyltransferase family 4 protein [Mangrovimonas cancribranchiae]|uniref:Glycosyltransferase family 4 protein n=1 Tax=Mangrovimonas cancribranchiae TaxID=3080055 RepID=A0AAU6PAM4_9FLAO
MKIGLVLSQAPAYSETFFKSKIKGLQKQGFNVILFCQENKTGFDGCEVKLFSKVSRHPVLQAVYVFRVFIGLLPHWRRVKAWYQLEQPKHLKTFLKQVYINAPILKSDLDWLHFGFATLAIQRETLAKAIEAKMAVSLRGFDIAIYPLKHTNCYAKLWQQVDKIHVISDDLLKKAYSLGLPKTVSFKKITPAINRGKFQPKVKQDLSQRKTYRILTVGRFHWKKGYVNMLEALAVLKQQGVEFKYTIVGEGEEYERITFAIHQLNLKDNVILLGKLPHDRIINLMEEHEVYLQYSISEGFCNAVLEAQAMALLCIVSDAEGLPENVVDGKTGWVVPKQQPKLLAEKLLEVVALPQDRKQVIQQQARERVDTHFTLAEQQKQFKAFYQAI